MAFEQLVESLTKEADSIKKELESQFSAPSFVYKRHLVESERVIREAISAIADLKSKLKKEP